MTAPSTNSAIGDLPFATALTGSEPIPVVQDNVTVQSSPEAIRVYLKLPAGLFTTGDLLYASSPTTLVGLPIGAEGKALYVSSGLPAWLTAAAGTVSTVSVVTAHGVSGSVANPTTTPAITLTLGAITPSSVAIGAGAAITSSGAGGALGSLAFLSAAPAGTLTGTALNATVVTSSLTAVGTLTSGAIGSGFTAIANSALANSSVTVNGTSIALGASGTVTAAAGTLTGGTLNSSVLASSLTSVGTLTGGATGAGFTVALGTSTITGLLAVANGGTGTATPGLVQGTNITITGSWPNQTITASGGSGSVTSVSVVTANGVSGSVATATTTPAITLTLGAITPTTVAIGAGSAITSSGAGGALGALAFVAPGTGVATALAINVGSAGAFVTFNGALGTPSSGTATNLTGLPIAGITGLGTGVGTALAISLGSAGALAGLATTQTFAAKQTLAGTSSVLAAVLTNAAEVITISATAATGTINYDFTTQSVLYYTTSASANWTVNFRASSGTSLDTALSTGQSITAAFLVTQGATAYYNSAVQVDGNAITPKWQGGTAPSAGNVSGIDVYTYTIVKTGSAAFTILASQTQFK